MSHTHKHDVVGSFLRPQYLKEARNAFIKGEITQAELTKVEDRAIRELVDKEIDAELNHITDGEFRRSWWHLDFFWGFGGIEFYKPEQGYFFSGGETRAGSVKLTGKIDGKNHPFLKDFKFLKDTVGNRAVPKLAVPAPAQILVELYTPGNRANTEKYYPNQADLHVDLAKAYQTFIAEFYDLGGRVLQLDDCTWGVLVDEKISKFLGYTDDVLEQFATSNVNLNNEAIAKAPEDLEINTHICRGNYKSQWAASGSYARISEILFGKADYDHFFLEFDDERSGDFQPLKDLKLGKKVVLGVVTSKFSQLEDKEQLKKRILDAAQYVPLENLSISPQCGFASTEEGNNLSEEEQWEKLKLIKEVSEEVWGK